jgi:uncharacterized surface anchored protein
MDKSQREIGIFTTNTQGKIILTGMNEGTYYLQETEAKPGYVLDSTVREVVLELGETTSMEIKNTLMATLRIKKVDALTGKPIPGTTFLLYDSKNNILGEYITNDKGMVDLPKELAAGKYKIKESKAATGYVLDDQPRTIELKPGEATEVVVENQPVRGNITITKSPPMITPSSRKRQVLCWRARCLRCTIKTSMWWIQSPPIPVGWLPPSICCWEPTVSKRWKPRPTISPRGMCSMPRSNFTVM